jgi:hypothetical protein
VPPSSQSHRDEWDRVCQAGLNAANATIVVDRIGIQYQAPLFTGTVIIWDDLSHFERFSMGDQ